MIPDVDEKVRRAHLAFTQAVMAETAQHPYTSSAFTTPIDTDVPLGSSDRSTPRAQTRQDYEDDHRRRSARISLNLAGAYLEIRHVTVLTPRRHSRV